MNLEHVGITLGAWALTFAVHSTILLLAALVLERWFRDRPEIMSPVWKLAALGAVVSASLQLSFGVEPLGGKVVVGPAPALEVVQPPTPVMPRPVPTVSPAPPPAQVAFDEALPAEPTVQPQARPQARPEPELPAIAGVIVDVPMLPPARPEPPAQPQPSGWLLALAAVFVLGAAIGIASIVRAWWGLHLQLRGRRSDAGVLAELLAGLLAHTRSDRRVRLSVSPTIAVPLATGVLRHEIVVPERALASLAVSAQESMLAHELAHVVRRDPAWRLALLLLERVLFFQPLLRLARRRVTQHAEYLADAWAVDNTSRPLELARCLTEIAGWVRPGPAFSLAPGMAEPRSILGRRVLRLVAPQRAAVRSRALPWLALAGLFAMISVAPAVGSAHPRAHLLRTAVGAAAPMMWMVHGDGRAAEVLETSPPGHSARAAVVVAASSAAPAEGRPAARAQRSAARKAAKERRATETALRRTIRAAHAQDRLPTVAELQIVLDHGQPRGKARQLTAVRVDPDGQSVVITLDAETMPDWVAEQLGDGDEAEAIRFAIVQSRRGHARIAGDREQAIALAEQLAAAHERRARAIERDVRRELERARAHADAHRRDAQRGRGRAEQVERARARALEDYARAWEDAARARAPRAPAPGRRHRLPAPPRSDIVPIVAPVAPLPPLPPTAALAPMPPAPPRVLVPALGRVAPPALAAMPAPAR